MHPPVILFLPALLITSALVSDPLTRVRAQPPIPAAQAILVCRLRHKQLLRGSSATAGEIELENSSPDVLEIETDRHPLQHLNLVVTDASRNLLSEGHYGDIFSPRGKVDTLRLAPGAKYQHPISLLETVPQEKRVSGTYLVRAVYAYNGLRVVSEPLAVELPGDGINAGPGS
jgi:hypothetical protein